MRKALYLTAVCVKDLGRDLFVYGGTFILVAVVCVSGVMVTNCVRLGIMEAEYKPWRWAVDRAIMPHENTEWFKEDEEKLRSNIERLERELRKANDKAADVDYQASLNWHKARVAELEARIADMEQGN